MQNVFDELNLAYGYINDQPYGKVRYNLLTMVDAIITTKDWSKGKHVDIVKATYKQGFKAFCQRSGVKEATARVIYARVSKTFREYIGYDTINKITFGNEKDLSEMNFRLSMLLSDYSKEKSIIPYVIELNKGVRNKQDYSIGELQAEISFLRRHCKSTIDKEYAELDKDKLAYIISILDDKKSVNLKDKCYLIKAISQVRKK